MVGGDRFDGLAKDCSAEIFDSHLRGGHRTDTSDIGVDAGHVLDQANFHHAVGDLFLGPGGEYAGEQQRGVGRDGGYSLHYYLPSGRFFGDASHRRSIPNTRHDCGSRREIPGLASISASRDQGRRI